MGICTLLTIHFLLKYLYFVPQCMLSVVAAVIGILLIEEAPYELYFHWKTRGIDEIITFCVTVVTTLFFSMEGGIAVGIGTCLFELSKTRHSLEFRFLAGTPTQTSLLMPTSQHTKLARKRLLGRT